MSEGNLTSSEKLKALESQGSDQTAVTAISVTGHVVSAGIVAQATYSAWSMGGMQALKCIGGRALAPIAGALAGAYLAQKVGADKELFKVAEFMGAKRQAGHGKAVAYVSLKIAHSNAFNGLIAGLVAGIVVGALVAATIGTGGLLAPLLIGAAAGFAGAAVAGAGSMMADITGTITLGSTNVYVEGKQVARVTDTVSCSRHSPSPQILEGSKTIFVNGLPLARVGHKIKCAAVIQEGAKTVFGDATNEMHGEPDSEITVLQQLAMSAIEVWGARSATRQGGLLDSLLRRLFGEPVDIVTGDYADYRTDFEYASVLPLSLKRTYPGKMQVDGLLGTRWICNWSQRLVYDDIAKTVLFEDAEGQRLVFPSHQEEFQVIHLKAPYYQLAGRRSAARIIDSRNGQSLLFGCAPGSSVGILHAIEDRNGNRIDFVYRQGHLREITHSDGVRFVVQTNLQGQLQSVTLQGESKSLVQYHFDDKHRLEDVYARFNGESHYHYNEHGWLTGWADSGPTKFSLEYDPEGRVIATRSSEGLYRDRFAYFPNERKSCFIESNGSCHTVWYNADNLVTKECDPLGNISTTEWDSCEQKISYTDTLGRKTCFEYDDQSRLIAAIDVGGRVQKIKWNVLDQPLTLDLPNGESQQWEYDHRGNCVAATGTDGVKTEFRYDPRGRLIEERRANVVQERWEYASDGRLLGYFDAAGAYSRIEQDSYRRVTALIDPEGKRTEFDFTEGSNNPRGNVAHVTAADGGVSHWEYDSEGKIAAQIGAAGQVTRYRHGAFDLLQSVTDPLGHSTWYHYDGSARLVSIRNALNMEWRFEYDAAGRTIAESDWAGRRTQFERDAAGRLRKKTLPDGSTQQYVWDDWDRLIEVTGDGTKQRYAYDSFDRLHSATTYRNESQESDISYTYDKTGRLIAEIQNGARIEYAYDALGRCVQRRTPGGSTQFSFDVRGELIAIHSNGHTLRIERNELGQEIFRQHELRQQLPQVRNAFTLQQEYDPCGRIKRQRAGAFIANLHENSERSDQGKLLPRNPQPLIHPSHLVDRRYQWDVAGRLTGIDDNLRGQKIYQYDQRDQVTQVDRSKTSIPDWGVEKYRYDASGNLLAHGAGLEQAHGYQKNCVTHAGNTRYQWDSRGQLIQRTVQTKGFRPQSWDYAWDSEGRMVQCRTPEGDIWRYAYDAFGRRISKSCVHRTSSGRKKTVATVQYFWNGPVIVEEWRQYADGSSAKPSTAGADNAGGKGKRSDIHRWHYAPGSFTPLAKECTQIVDGENVSAANESHFYPIVTDHLGTPKEIYSSEGECLWKADHALWGEWSAAGQRYRKAADMYDATFDSAQSEVACDLRFANQWSDEESGLYYNLNRYYDPHSGQYASSDPIGLAGGLRTHGYVHNPVTWMDPLGLYGCDPKARQHILDGDSPTSGGHMWPGNPGKSTFPQSWGRAKIIAEVDDIVNSPNTKWYAQTGSGGALTNGGDPAKWVAWETRDGVLIRVIYQPAIGRIVTAFPETAPIPVLPPAK